ncbi:hypothetical protein S40293_06338 [Stachybotrys chartarum IBT 40293]|nr:hypothetical protein S40293_06338 [Stachybotrys chartarum IBT 40293]
MAGSTTSQNEVANIEGLVGWVNDDDTRGTWSIITSCLFTIVICTWTAIHPRIHVSRSMRHRHKFYQLVKALLAPEMVCLESIQEFIQARKVARRCAQATNGRFKLIHGFYVSMLGIRYRVGNEGGYRTLWPAQYAWLLNNGLISWDDHKSWGLAVEDIEDKNKADGLVKLATLVQVIWFTVQSVTRGAHNLPLAALETMTLAYVLNAIMTYAFWWKKPKDIATASFIVLPEMTADQKDTFGNLSMENTYDVPTPGCEPDPSSAWYVVARDYEDNEMPVMAPKPDRQFDADSSSADANVEAQVSNSTKVQQHRADNAKVITEWDASLYMTRYWPLLCLLGASFGAVHLVSWDSAFPTTVELWLWRSSALMSVVTAVLCMQFRTMSLTWDGPLTVIKVGSPLLYIVSRLIMAAETFAALRAMEARTYVTYELLNYWFHFF